MAVTVTDVPNTTDSLVWARHIAQRPGQGGPKIAGGEHSRRHDRVRIQERKGRFPSPTHSIPDQLAEAKRGVSESPFRAAAGKGEEVPPEGAVMLDRPPDRSMRTGVPGFEGEDPRAHGPESTGGAEKTVGGIPRHSRRLVP